MIARLSPYWLWLLLSLPALGMVWQIATAESEHVYHMILHPTGENAVRLLIITLAATPLAMLFKGWRFSGWLKKNRRYFGVAAFGYAALHTLAYVVDEGTLDRIVAELPRTTIWTGWLAFLIFIPLAATSMDYAVRKMGPAWKSLQRWVYAAAVLTVVHWAALHNWNNWTEPFLQFSPLIALTGYRLWWVYLRPRPARTA